MNETLLSVVPFHDFAPLSFSITLHIVLFIHFCLTLPVPNLLYQNLNCTKQVYIMCVFKCLNRNQKKLEKIFLKFGYSEKILAKYAKFNLEVKKTSQIKHINSQIILLCCKNNLKEKKI